ncbi:MAG: hypothetical protein EP349_10255 [Alphaproteobacteria bacterium]|nr:MAG: hypothetical protein EP349_10255 [Alphaproteobacteria bacterium]
MLKIPFYAILLLSACCLMLLCSGTPTAAAEDNDAVTDVLEMAYDDAAAILLDISPFMEAEILLGTCREKGVADTLTSLLSERRGLKITALLDEYLDTRQEQLAEIGGYGEYKAALILTAPAKERGFFIGYLSGIQALGEDQKNMLCDEGMFLADTLFRSQ